MSENMGTTSIPPDIGRNIEATAEAGVESLGPARTNAEFLEARKLGASKELEINLNKLLVGLMLMFLMKKKPFNKLIYRSQTLLQ